MFQPVDSCLDRQKIMHLFFPWALIQIGETHVILVCFIDKSLYSFQSLCSFFEARACNHSRADIRSKGGSLDSCWLTKCCEDDKCNGAMKSDENTVSVPQDNLTATPIAGATGHNCVSFIFLINCAMISLMWWFPNWTQLLEHHKLSYLYEYSTLDSTILKYRYVGFNWITNL